MSKDNPEIPKSHSIPCKVNERDYLFKAHMEPVPGMPESLQITLGLTPGTVNHQRNVDHSALTGVLSSIFSSLDGDFPGSFVQISGYTPGQLTFTHDRPEDKSKLLSAFQTIPARLQATLEAFHTPPSASSGLVLDTEDRTGEKPRPRRIIDPPSMN